MRPGQASIDPAGSRKLAVDACRDRREPVALDLEHPAPAGGEGVVVEDPAVKGSRGR